MYGGKVTEFFYIDDALDVFSVHCLNGVWGTIAVGCWGRKEFMNPDFDYGIFYGGTGDCLAWQVCAAAVSLSISGSVAFCTFGLMFVVGKYIIGIDQENPLRVSLEEELLGLDIKEFDGYAYPENKEIIDVITSEAMKGMGEKVEKANDSNIEKVNKVVPTVGRQLTTQASIEPV